MLEALAHTAEHERTSPEKLLERLRKAGRDSLVREDLRVRKAIDLLAESAKPIPVAQAEAREQLWTPDKEGAGGGAGQGLWTPGLVTHRARRGLSNRHRNPRLREESQMSTTQEATFAASVFLAGRDRLRQHPRRPFDRGRLHRRRDRGAQLRGGLHRTHRSRRGGSSHLRSRSGLLCGAGEQVLRPSRSDPAQPPGPRLRPSVPLGDLLPQPRAGARCDRGQGAGPDRAPQPGRDRDRPRRAVLPGRGLSPALPGEARDGHLPGAQRRRLET